MVLGYHTEYLTCHSLDGSWGEIRVVGTNGSGGYISLRWFKALCVFMDNAYHSLPGSSDANGKGWSGACCSASVFFLLQTPGPASAWVTRSSQEAPSPAPPSIQDGSVELPEVVRPPALLFPEALGATAPHLMGLWGCWSALGCSMGSGGTGIP